MLSGDGGLPALDRAAQAVEQLERDRRALHARALRAALDLHAAQCANRMGLGTVAQLALSLDCSELRAGQLLTEAQVLGLLPDAFEALDTGLLGVEQSAAFVSLSLPLSDHHRSPVWDQLLARLHSTGLPSPARMREWLARCVRTVDPPGAAARRRAAEADGDVSARRRDDGLTDLHVLGPSPSNAAACRARIDAASAPWGSDDDRTAGKRRARRLRRPPPRPRPSAPRRGDGRRPALPTDLWLLAAECGAVRGRRAGPRPARRRAGHH